MNAPAFSMASHAFRCLPYSSLSPYEMILLSTSYSCETDNRDASMTCKNRHHFSFMCLQLGWSSLSPIWKFRGSCREALLPCLIFLGPMDYWRFILLIQMAKAQEGKPYRSSTLPAFACVTSANISLAKTSHVA